MVTIYPSPLANTLGFLALASYVITLLPGIFRVVFPKTRKTYISQKLLKFRRLIGIVAFFFSLGHGLLFIEKRYIDFYDYKTYWIYVQGVVIFGIFAILALTSNNWSIKKLKKNWKKLHSLTYIAMFFLAWHVWGKMAGHWTYLTPIGIVLITGIMALYLIRLRIEYEDQQLTKLKKVFQDKLGLM